MSSIFHGIASIMGTVAPRRQRRDVCASLDPVSFCDRLTSRKVRRSRGPVRRLSRWIAMLSIILLAGCTAPVEVKWSTETEMNTAGFNLYRSESESGPFDLKVNDQIIPASPDPLTGGDYSYLDRTAQSGVTYYYELEEVEQTGSTTRHGPIPAESRGLGIRDAVLIVALAGCGFGLSVGVAKIRSRRRVK